MPSETCNRVRVERFFLEEAGADERKATDQHLKGCGRCQEHLDFLARERQAYLAVRPFTSFAAKHLEKKAPALGFSFGPLFGSKWLPALGGALAVVALVAVLRYPGADKLQGGSAIEDVGYKGGEALSFHYSRDGKVQEGDAAAEYRAGDALQFTYDAGKKSHVALLSVDAQGKVSLYREGSGPVSFAAQAGKVEAFPFSLTLDAAPGRELFVALFTNGPVEDAALEAWLSGAWKAAAGDLEALRKNLAAPAAAPKGVVKALLLKKAAP